jgi:glycosyltransferase involved in cell wall biosynthesis
MKRPMISFVIPAKNEAESLPILYEEITVQLKKLSCSYEILLIDDGSTDATYDIAQKLSQKDPQVKVFRHRGNFGKSIALQTGFNNSKGEIIITMDADLQDNPKEIPNFIKKINEGYDLVSGWKKIRHDPLSKILPSKLGNWLTKILTGVKINDMISVISEQEF